MSHTPGPWVVETDADHPGNYTIKGVFEDFEEAYNSNNPQSAIAMNKQDDANMRLIAASPKLLKACKAMRDGWGHNLTEPMALINAAIDEAEAD